MDRARGMEEVAGRTVLLTYADARFVAGRTKLAESARRAGFDHVIEAGPEAFAGTDFARRHAATLAAPRGGGYWLWKPWLIRETLHTLGPHDVLFYCDASADGFYRFDRFPAALIDLVRASAQGFVIGPKLWQHGPLSRWSKRDALMLLGGDRPDRLAEPLAQATWSLWRATDTALAFLDEWLAACEDPRVLTDVPNTLGEADHPDFVDHRHDQTALTLIALRRGAEILDLSPTGIFRLMALRPQAEMTHRLLKAPRNADRLLRGQPAVWVMAREIVARRVARRATAA